MFEIPEGRRATKGKSIMNFLSLSAEEKVTSIVAMDKDKKATSEFLLLVTKDGVAKKVSAESFKEVRRSGLIAIKLSAGDELYSANFMEKGDEAIIATKKGQSIRFKGTDIREMGRSAGGVRGMKLSKGDHVVGVGIIKKDLKDATLLVMSENGFGKRTELKEYKTQKRGGSGIKTAKVTSKTGDLVVASLVTDEVSEIIAISKKGQVIKTDIESISVLGRQTQGVKIMKPRAGDSLASLTCL